MIPCFPVMILIMASMTFTIRRPRPDRRLACPLLHAVAAAKPDGDRHDVGTGRGPRAFGLSRTEPLQKGCGQIHRRGRSPFPEPPSGLRRTLTRKVARPTCARSSPRSARERAGRTAPPLPPCERKWSRCGPSLRGPSMTFGRSRMPAASQQPGLLDAGGNSEDNDAAVTATGRSKYHPRLPLPAPPLPLNFDRGQNGKNQISQYLT